MTDPVKKEEGAKAPRDRSPAFPFISLKVAVERLADFDTNFGRHPTPAGKSALAWGMKEGSSQAIQTLAAMKYFGLIEYEGSGAARKALISEDARNYLRAQQEHIKKELLKKFALNPKEMSKFWGLWGKDRPHDAVCLDKLVIESGYNETYAPRFLKVYDETIAYAGLTPSDKVQSVDDKSEDDENAQIFEEEQVDSQEKEPLKRPNNKKGFALMENERVLQDGILSQNASYRIVVSGKVGPKEIERLIKKLELDKEILAESMEEEADLSSMMD